VVEDAAGRSGQDLSPGGNGLDLLGHRGAAVDGRYADASKLSELLDLAPNLKRELPSGAQDQDLRDLGGRANDAVDDGQTKGSGLSSPRAGLHDEAAALGGGLENRPLDGSGMGVPHRIHGAADVGLQRQNVESRFRRRRFRGWVNGSVHRRLLS
jgi:hypothetical protein